ncbi:MAG TPA: DUF1735 domain-containing protein [Parafilimonas sp.]|jgi:hypothetical protein
MKLFSIKSIVITSAFLSIITTGCLKDKAFDNGSIQSTHGPETKVVEIKLTASTTSNFFVFAVNASDNDTTADLVPINLATADPAPQDLHVTVDLDSTLVDAYDTANADYYATPPSNLFSIVNPVVTIPKGSHTAYVEIKFKPIDFISGHWALGFRITAIQEPGYVVSGNLNTGVTAIVIKNQYDGLYYAHGVFNHPTLGGPFVYDNLPLSTSGANSVDMYAQPYGNNNVLGAYPRLTVNADNSVTVTSADPSLVFNGPFDPNYHSHYDPATRTFYINYGYTTSAPRTAYDTLVYTGPR